MSKKLRRLKKRIKRDREKRYKIRFKCDMHHILWQRRQWKGVYSRRVREFWWLKVLIPTDTLHHAIHDEINFIPVPNEKVCKEIFDCLVDMEKRGSLSQEQSFETRLQFLICLTDCREPQTANALKKQLQIVREFYARPP